LVRLAIEWNSEISTLIQVVANVKKLARTDGGRWTPKPLYDPIWAPVQRHVSNMTVGDGDETAL
jgi:hypothetical protein